MILGMVTITLASYAAMALMAAARRQHQNREAEAKRSTK